MTAAGAKVEIGPWVSAGFKMFTSQWQTWVKMAALAFLPMVIPMIGFMVGYIGLMSAIVPTYDPYGGYHPAEPPIWAFGVLGLSSLLMIAAAFVSLYFTIGMWKAALKQARGGIPEMSDMRGNGALFWRVFGASFVVGLILMVGFMLCYIPGFIFMAWYYFVIPLVIDRQLTIGEAMTQSKAVTSPQLLMFILWAFIVSILSQLGVYVCYIGLVATLPLQFTMNAVAYRAAFEGVSPQPAQPGAPPPGAPPAASY